MEKQMYKQKALYYGECFYKTGTNIVPDNYLSDEWLESDDDDCYWFIPSMVNMAFSCELFFKSLLSDGNSMVKGHSLEELFYKLSPDLQKRIMEHPEFKDDDSFLII